LLNSSEILIIDSDPQICSALAPALKRDGYRVTFSASDLACRYLRENNPALILLCLDLPIGRGGSVIEEAHSLYPLLPILVTTAYADIKVLISALRKGARDYFIKPLQTDAVLAKIKRLVELDQKLARRREIIAQMNSLLAELRHINRQKLLSKEEAFNLLEPDWQYLKCGPFGLDLLARQANLEGEAIALSPTAFEYLHTLARHSPHSVSHERLVSEAQGYDLSRSEAKELARWHIHELRRVIETDPKTPHFIITVRDVGYMLIP
jgi:DNA-binding response OmpR family regulator